MDNRTPKTDAFLKEAGFEDELFPDQKELADFARSLETSCGELERDALRYRWLRDTFHKAVGAGVEVNERKLVYEESVPGEEVRVYWYPNTPVGFHQILAATLDEAIDEALKEKA